MPRSRRIQSRVWALISIAVAGACIAGPAPTQAGVRAGSALDSAGLASPPRSVVPHAMSPSTVAGPDYAGALWEPASPLNYTVADRPAAGPITRLVIHVAEGSWASTYTWFRNPRAEASAHYVVSSTGRVAQMVPDRDIAWHAGNWAYNVQSIGIEHAGFTNVTRFPDAEYRGSARLAAWLADSYLITPDRAHVIGHSQVPDPNHPGLWGGVDHHTDPGRTWDWARYMAYLRAAAGDTPQALVDNAAPSAVRYDPSVWHVASAQRGRYGADYLAAAPHTTSSPVRFRVSVPATARYDLLMRWPCGADSARAGVGVTTTAGLRTVTVDEARGCGRFQYVGSYRLAAGLGWRLRVSSASSARGTIVADAFKLVEQSDPVRPAAPAVTTSPAETSIGLSWTRASDNVAVGGYRVYVDSKLRFQGTGRAFSVTGLACNSVHTVSVRALDMVSNLSLKAPVWVRTAPCPPAPTGLVATPTQASVALTWTAPAAGLSYRVLKDGTLVGRTTAPHLTVSPLHCARAHTFSVESVDATGSVSALADVNATTLAC
ncbi:MAG TPA: N-acetylmuramoyl-L-alanine amidase [Gaiellales bacterium]|nr:N-acetylmuramoyl-L-alanine amidase [Gaiellales bacterium]